MLRQIQSDHANCYSSILLFLSGIFVKRNKVVVGCRVVGCFQLRGGGCDMRDTILFFRL